MALARLPAGPSVEQGCGQWRRYGERFNERTCSIGRSVILGRGYTPKRLIGTITLFDVRPAEGGAIELYGADEA